MAVYAHDGNARLLSGGILPERERSTSELGFTPPTPEKTSVEIDVSELKYPQEGQPSENRFDLPENPHSGHLTASNLRPHEGQLSARRDTEFPQFSQ